MKVSIQMQRFGSFFCIFFGIFSFISNPLLAHFSDKLSVFIESIPEIEKEYLARFFKVFFLEDDFSYTLFGEKPMSFSGIYNKNLKSFEETQNLLHVSESLSLLKAIETLKKYRNHFHENYLFVLNENSNGLAFYFINKKCFLQAIDENVDVFLKELGEDFTPVSFLNKILEEKKSFLDIIHYHEGILGILLGYGRHNSLLFQKKADILGRCWAYDQEVRQSSAKFLHTYNLDSKTEELNALDNQLLCFSKENEYCALIPVSPLGFGADLGHVETKKLKEKYTHLRNRINEIYAQFNPIEVILKMLLENEFDPQKTSTSPVCWNQKD